MSTIKNIDGPKDFIFRVLSGVAIGIVAGLVPNAILGEIFKYFMQYHPIFKTLLGRSSHPIYSASAYWSIDSYEVQYDTISNSCSKCFICW